MCLVLGERWRRQERPFLKVKERGWRLKKWRLKDGKGGARACLCKKRVDWRTSRGKQTGTAISKVAQAAPDSKDTLKTLRIAHVAALKGSRYRVRTGTMR